MKYFWRIANVLLIAFAAWTGIWGTAPERLHDTGFVRSAAALGPNTPPLWIVALVISVMSAGYTFFAMRRAGVEGVTFRLPSLDRSPFRQRSDPLQTFGIQFAALLCCAMAATVGFSSHRVWDWERFFFFVRGRSLSALADYSDTLYSDRAMSSNQSMKPTASRCAARMKDEL